MHVLLAQPRGFCAGVNRAIAIVERALEVYGRPIYVRHEIVHNKTVVNELKAKGAIFIEHLREVPDGATVILSAHGVPQKVKDYAASRPLRIFDAACPLVLKVHREVIKMHSEGLSVIVVGHKGHAEVEGTMGQVKDNIYRVYTLEEVQQLQVPDPEKVGYVTQTTLSTDETKEVIAWLKEKFPKIRSLSAADICYATQSRQQAVKALAAQVQLVLVMSRAAGLYLLDEPIGGVDPAARDYILDTIIRNYSEDAALVLSTHLIGDIEKVLDDVVMIGGGRLVASGSVDELRAAQGKSVDAFFREVFKC